MKQALKRALSLILITSFLISVLSITTSTFANHQKIGNEVLQKTSSIDGSLIPVIVQTKQGLKEKHGIAVQKSGGQLKHDLALIKGFAAEMTVAGIEELAKDEEVIRITYDYTVSTCLDTAPAATNAPAVWEAGFTGKGITVAVIDTGIYPHPDLTEPNNRIIGFKDFINKRLQPYDDNGHGTHVAGIIAGNGTMSDGAYKGVAPEANLVGVKVLNSVGSGSISNVIAGMQWVVENKNTYEIRVVNMSLGAYTNESYTTDPLSQAAQAVWDAGIVIVAAAGNNGPVEGSINTPGINPSIITVGAADHKGTVETIDDVVAFFSSRGPTMDGVVKPELVAPGFNITSLAADTSYVPKKNNSPKVKPEKPVKAPKPTKPGDAAFSQFYVTFSGTSMATPMVAGSVVLWLEQNPNWTPDEVKREMMNAAVDLGFGPNEQGAGEVRNVIWAN